VDPAALPAAAPADCPLACDAQLVERQDRRRARLDPGLGKFLQPALLRGHWERYAEGCEAVGRRPDPAVWRVARCVLVTESDAEADDYLAASGNGLDYYYSFFRRSLSEGRNALFMLKPSTDMTDDAATVGAIKRSQVIAGSPRRVLEQLVALRKEAGRFGTLLMTGHDWTSRRSGAARWS